MRKYEIEIKSLLGNKEKAEDLKKRLKDIDPSTEMTSRHKQLNHYFIDGDPRELYERVKSEFSKETADKLKKIIDEGHDFSIRTREADGDVRLVVKASIDDTTSANGITRIEFEENTKCKNIDELDQLVLSAGFEYQAKWSREREEYICKGANVSIDKNAGYGYLAEFEKIIEDSGAAEEAKKELRSLMEDVGAVELTQDRLERMFSYYNEHWPEYYGTDKIFVIE